MDKPLIFEVPPDYKKGKTIEEIGLLKEMLAEIWDVPTEEVMKSILEKYEEKIKAKKVSPESLPELPKATIEAAVDVLNQVLPANAKLSHDLTSEEMLRAYRENHENLQKFLNLPVEDWKPSGDDKKDLELIARRFKPVASYSVE